MINFIPIELYTSIFNYLILLLVVIAAYQGFTGNLLLRDTVERNAVLGIILIVVVILYMGLRPVLGHYFGDTTTYAYKFYQIQDPFYIPEVNEKGEYIFFFIMGWFAKYSSVHIFFLFCSTVYIGALWWAMKRIFGDYYYIPLLVAMSMFTFWAYGVNGVRNGMASSIVILAISFRKNLPVAIGLSILAIGIHKSLMLTVGAAVLAWFVTNPRIFIYMWFGSIALSIALGNNIGNFFLALGIGGDDRFESYLTSTQYAEQFSRIGFRWDFLLYSAMPILIGWYFIFKKKYTDEFYLWIFNIYLITNSFWVLVIRTAFSNRFAQLSWFIMPLVLIYPFVKKQFWSDQQEKLGWFILVFYSLTFYFNIL